ncbi:MAG: amidase [Anaerolineaceae bacterium]|nr:amidase [Anaerolineaceae bacterium]
MTYSHIPTTLKAIQNNETDLHEVIDQLKTSFEKTEETLFSFLTEDRRFERLHQEAEELYHKYPTPESRPALFGLLIGVKDIFRAKGFETRAGSRLPAELFAGAEAESVSLMKAAGALVMGKTVSTEFAYFAPGKTTNPVNSGHTPGGSSSGSAAAVGAGLAPFAFGSQTIGSISRPASYCGVVGLKPSFGRISREGVIPVSLSVDHVGYFTKNVLSAQFTAPFLYKDWQVKEYPSRKPIVGIPIGPLLDQADEEMLKHFENRVNKLEQAGYQVKRVQAMPDFDEINQRHNAIVAVDAAEVHQDWFKEYRHLYHPKTVELILKGQKTTHEEYQSALPGRGKLRHELSALMNLHQIELWLSPGAQGAAPLGLDSTGLPIMNMPWTHCGFPTLTVPMGINPDGLPLGMQIAADWYQDEFLLEWALELEKVLL